MIYRVLNLVEEYKINYLIYLHQWDLVMRSLYSIQLINIRIQLKTLPIANQWLKNPNHKLIVHARVLHKSLFPLLIAAAVLLLHKNQINLSSQGDLISIDHSPVLKLN